MICPYCKKDVYEIETCCTSSDFVFDDEDGDWVSFQGFVERTKCCHNSLGEGYGDANYYPTKEEAQKNAEEWKKKIGEWF